MTRMWLLPPHQMCPQHVTGAHYELHKLAGGIKAALDGNDTKRAQIAGQARDGNIDVRKLAGRHAELESHGGWDSPLPWTPADAPGADLSFAEGDIRIIENRRDLEERCPDCRALLEVAA